MNILEAVVVGVVQGVTEWLPVSSEAVITLILTQFLGTDPSQALNASIFLHTGTMLAAAFYFREDYLDIIHFLLRKALQPRNLLQNPYSIFEEESGKLSVFLVVSTALTGVVGAAVYFLGIEAAVENPQIFYILMSAALFLTGILRLYTGSSERNYLSVNIPDSVLAGFLQGFSIVPGISRSGTTSFAFLFRGFDARSSFKLSFLMSVPAVLVGNIGLGLLTDFTYQPLYILSTAVAGIVGYLTIETVLEVADRSEVAWICFGLGILALLPLLI